MSAQKPVHHGRTEACPLWAHRSLPTIGAQMPAHHGRTDACPLWAHRRLHTMDALRLTMAAQRLRMGAQGFEIDHMIIKLVRASTK